MHSLQLPLSSEQLAELIRTQYNTEAALDLLDQIIEEMETTDPFFPQKVCERFCRVCTKEGAIDEVPPDPNPQ